MDTLKRNDQIRICSGCGCLIPIGVRMRKRKGGRFFFCPKCTEAMLDCSKLSDFPLRRHGYSMREVCGSCDDYMFCEHVVYLRKNTPGKTLFYGVPPMETLRTKVCYTPPVREEEEPRFAWQNLSCIWR